MEHSIAQWDATPLFPLVQRPTTKEKDAKMKAHNYNEKREYDNQANLGIDNGTEN